MRLAVARAVFGLLVGLASPSVSAADPGAGFLGLPWGAGKEKIVSSVSQAAEIDGDRVHVVADVLGLPADVTYIFGVGGLERGLVRWRSPDADGGSALSRFEAISERLTRAWGEPDYQGEFWTEDPENWAGEGMWPLAFRSGRVAVVARWNASAGDALLSIRARSFLPRISLDASHGVSVR